MDCYRYEGPVLDNFGKEIAQHWVEETTASSEAKARTNISWKIKSSLGKDPKHSKIGLPGKLIKQ